MRNLGVLAKFAFNVQSFGMKPVNFTKRNKEKSSGRPRLVRKNFLGFLEMEFQPKIVPVPLSKIQNQKFFKKNVLKKEKSKTDVAKN